MAIFLIFLYFVINIFIIVKYYKFEFGVFQAPFLAACTCMGVFLPQLSSIYLSTYYDHSLLFNLLFVMCTCSLAFAIGFELGKNKKLPSKMRDIDIEKSKVIFFILAIIGLAAAFSISGAWMNELEGGEKSNFLIMVNLTNFLELAYVYSFTYLIKLRKRDKIIIAIVILASFLYLENIILLGRRNLALRLCLIVLFYFSLYYPKYYKFNKVAILLIFLLGSVLSSSIGEIRTNLRVGTDSGNEVDYLQNFNEAFAQKDFSIGMDLGNAALGIDYCYENNDYDYGLHLWNSFVFNFIPKFLFGEEFKNSLMVKFNYSDLIPKVTKNITTMTGYFDAFASFSYLAFIKFLFMGYILGLCWAWSFQSSLYRILYMLLFTQVSSVFTHSSQYIFMRIEFFALFCLPLIAYFFYTKRKILAKRKISGI